MRVAAYQAPYRPFPSAGGAELVAEKLDRLQEDGVEILVCPEAMIGELANESDGDAPRSVALHPTNGELRTALALLLGWRMTIVIGFTELGSDDAVYNSAAVIVGGDVVGVYRKTYPGRSACRAGDELPVFCHRDDVPFGVLICNDAHYVEPARVLAMRGAKLIVVPVHGGHRVAKEAAWRARGTNVLVARAVENGVPVVAADVAGWQGDRVSHGTTAIVDSQGTIVSRSTELIEEVIVADVALDDGPRGGIDGELLGRANPAVTDSYLALWHPPRRLTFDG